MVGAADQFAAGQRLLQDGDSVRGPAGSHQGAAKRDLGRDGARMIGPEHVGPAVEDLLKHRGRLGRLPGGHQRLAQAAAATTTKAATAARARTLQSLQTEIDDRSGRPFPQAALAVQFPGGGRQWLIDRLTADAPLPAATAFQSVERHRSQVSFSLEELSNLRMVTEQPVAHIRPRLSLRGIRLGDYAYPKAM
jgi:hypothetical protein